MRAYFALLLLPALAMAQHTHGSTDGTAGTLTMIPYLHFTPGEAILFREWVPKKPGPFAGACIGLFLLAMLDRWLGAMRRIMEVWWKRRVDVILAKRFIPLDRSSQSSREKGSGEDGVVVEVAPNSRLTPPRPTLSFRNAAPFIPAHDFARGAMVVIQTAITYALMLSVMTFNAGLIISILIGLGVGEIAFGRFAYAPPEGH